MSFMEIRKTPAKPTHVFVYGTLKKGGRLAGYFDSTRVSVTPSSVHGMMFDVGSFPAVVKLNTANTIVKGELHEFDPEDMDLVINYMDRLEGCRDLHNTTANLYNRTQVRVKKGDKTVLAWVYEFNKSTDGMPKIEEGEWVIQQLDVI